MNRDTIVIIALAIGVIALVVVSQRQPPIDWRKLVNRAQGGAYGAR